MENARRKSPESLIGSYALSGGLNTTVFTVTTLYLSMFMTDYLGISPMAMAGGMLIARCLDLAVSVLAGILMEKARPKGGKYLGWLRPLTVPLVFGGLLQLLDTTAFVSSTTLRLIIVMTGYLLFEAAVDFYTPARAAILPRLCGADMELRKKFTARQNQMGAAAVILSSAVTLPAVRLLEKLTGRESWGYFAVTLLFAGLFAAVNLIFCRQAAPYDPPEPQHADTAKSPTVGQLVSSLRENGQMLVLFLCFFLFTIGNQLYTGCLAYFFRVTDRFSSYTAALTARSAAAFGATLAAPGLAGKLGKKSIIVLSWGLIAAAGFAVKFFAFTGGQANIPLMTVCMCLWQAAVNLYMAFQAVYWLDCGEYGYTKTGVDSRAMAVSVMNWPNKLGFMLGGSLVGWLLAWAGYTAPSSGSAGSFASMDRFMSALGLIPGALAALAAVGVLLFYRLTDEKAAECARANAQREARDKS